MVAITFEIGRHTLEDVRREMFLAAYDECKGTRNAMYTVSKMLGISHKQAYIWRNRYGLLLAGETES